MLCFYCQLLFNYVSIMPTTELTETESTTDVAIVPATDSQSCENCHQPLNGPFCAHCGQSTDSTLKYFWVVILHLLDDIFSFDSRASRTLWPLVIRPAFLTNEYFAGRRVHYVPPLRLYLFISIIFFLTLQFFVAADENNVISIKDKKELVTQVESHIEKLKTEQSTLNQQPSESLNGIESIESIKTSEELSRLNAKIDKFNNYLVDFNRDDNSGQNKQIIKLTRELVEIELEQLNEALSKKEQTHFDALMARRLKVIEGGIISEELNIGNNEDGTLSLDFLSADANAKLNKFTDELKEKGEKAFNSDTGPLLEEIIGKLPQLMFILLPLFAVLLKVMFIFSKRLYMEHLTVALHSHSFIFIAILLSEMLDLSNDYLVETNPNIAGFCGVVAGVLLVWIPIYLFIMQKRVYKQGYFFTFVKFGVIGMVYSMLIIFTGLIALVWGIMGT